MTLESPSEKIDEEMREHAATEVFLDTTKAVVGAGAQPRLKGWLMAQVYQQTEFERIARTAMNGGYTQELDPKKMSMTDIVEDVNVALAAGHPAVLAGDDQLVVKMKRAWSKAKAAAREIQTQAFVEEANARDEYEEALQQVQQDTGNILSKMQADLIESNPEVLTDGLPVPAAEWVPQWYGPDGRPVSCNWVKPGSGYRCTRKAIAPTQRCDIHGGLLIDQKKMGELLQDGAKKLIAAADMAIDVLVELAQSSPNDLVRVRAAEDILDRAGLKPGVTIDVNVTMADSPAAVIAERLDKLASFATAKNSNVIDAEVVEEVESGDS